MRRVLVRSIYTKSPFWSIDECSVEVRKCGQLPRRDWPFAFALRVDKGHGNYITKRLKEWTQIRSMHSSYVRDVREISGTVWPLS